MRKIRRFRLEERPNAIENPFDSVFAALEVPILAALFSALARLRQADVSYACL
jgi:hypothetical protein